MDTFVLNILSLRILIMGKEIKSSLIILQGGLLGTLARIAVID